MAKEFNPDEFLQDTAPIAEAQADIERRNAERTAAGQPPLTSQQQRQAVMSPSGGPVIPTNQPGMLENMAANVYGVAKPVVDIGGAVLSNPAVQTGLELAGGGIAAKKFLVNPILDKLAAGGQQVGTPGYPLGGTPGPTPPTQTPPTQTPSIIQRGMDYASKMRQIAADKVVQGANAAKTFATETVVPNASNIAKAGVGAAAMLTPGNIGQNYPFPTKGPYAGMEINPRTGRPWTQQELAQYR